MGESKIEWTERTWNPIVGCSILTPGCTNCYAMKMAARIEAMLSSPKYICGGARHYLGTTKKVNGNAVWTGKLALAPEHILLEPLKRKKPTTYFVNSMGDLFHEACPDEWIDKVFAVMALCPRHTFQVLTKRAERMRTYMTKPTNIEGFSSSAHFRVGCAAALIAHDMGVPYQGDGGRGTWPLPNVWLGVSAERQQEADERIPHLLQTPAAVRFISAEPLLGHIDLHALNIATDHPSNALRGVRAEPDTDPTSSTSYRNLPTAKLDWVIVGGESGPNARPMHPDWPRAIRDQCAAAGVAYFFKQWGEHAPVQLDSTTPILRDRMAFGKQSFPFRQFMNVAMVQFGKKRSGRKLDGVEHNAMPVSKIAGSHAP